MLFANGAKTTNSDVSRFSITLDDELGCLVELACKFGYIIGAGVLPAVKFYYFESFSGSSLTKQ